MTQYIDKSALVAEIERLEKKNKKSEYVYDSLDTEYTLKSIISFINTLEVKEVDLEKESELIAYGIMISIQSNNHGTNIYNTERNDFNHHHLQIAARKGIELGLKASNVLNWEDMKQIHDIMVECSAIGLWSKPDEEYYQEVVKRFKAQKGE